MYYSVMNSPTTTQSASAQQVFFSLLRVAHGLEDRLEASLAEVGLSGAKFGALSKLVEAKEPLPLSELAARVACVRSNITQLVDRLEDDGLVRRLNDPSDRRSVRAEVTPLGRERHRAGAERVEAIQIEFAAALDGVDRQALERALESLKK
jgi:DNA-binding MarR family transcriptional regulator